MKDVRIGNDISVIWSLYSYQKPFLLDGLKISVYLKGMYGKTKIEDYTIKGNKIHWTFFGKDQKHTGKYSLTLVVNEGAEGMVTTDVCDLVRLVSCTCQVDGSDEDGVQTEAIAVNSEVELLSGEIGRIDTALDPMSENAVQNKVITEELNNKVDKVSGKQLSTEDFTTELKTKLEGMNLFDPTEINNKVDNLQTQINTLVSGDTSTAIESFNEIIAFLNGVQDSESLEGIIAGIERQITNKQDTIADLDAIRSGAALGATAIQSVKTINGQSIEGEGNITIEGGGSNITVDSELSDTSENPVQNKVVKSTFDGFAQEVIRLHEEQGAGMQEMSTNLYTELLKKVDKVSGKQLSTEDFTTALKTKLEGLNNYDDTAIQNAVNSLTTQIADKVDKTYVDNAIANAITTTLNTAV